MTSLRVKETPAVPIKLDTASFLSMTMTDEQFYDFCQKNPELRIEQTAEGEVIVMPPAFSDTGNRNFNIAVEVGIWARQDGTGEGFDSSAGFTLPDGAKRSPDTSWILKNRWNALSPDQKSSFAPICPDFVIELRSSSDKLKSLQNKLQEYIDNGAKLGLLIDRKNRNVHIYRPEQEPQILENPSAVSCSPELPGCSLPMSQVW